MTTVATQPQQAPESVDVSLLSAEERTLLLQPKNQTLHLNPFTKIPDTEEVRAGAADLTAMFAASLTKEEVAFHTPVKVVEQNRTEAPRNFLQAHMVIIDQLLMDPAITTTKLASVTGYSRSWLHKIMQSDSFQVKLAERQKAIIDPIVLSTIKDRLNGLVSRSLEILEERMESDKVDLNTALNVFDTLGKSAALGLQQKQPANVNNFVVHVPAQMTSATDWAQMHGGGQKPAVLAEPLDITPHKEASGATEGAANE